MNTTDIARPDRQIGIRSPRQFALMAASVACLALVTAACSKSPAGPGVAQLTSTASSVSSAAAATNSAPAKGPAALLAYSQCMRAHGVPDFPDPVGNTLQISGGPNSDLNPDSPQFQTAQTACKALEPGRGDGGGKADPKAQAQALKYSACMRSHGVPDFPDPVFSNGGIQFKINGDPNSAQFKDAQKACTSLQPIGPGGGGGPSDRGGSGDAAG